MPVVKCVPFLYTGQLEVHEWKKNDAWLMLSLFYFRLTHVQFMHYRYHKLPPQHPGQLASAVVSARMDKCMGPQYYWEFRYTFIYPFARISPKKEVGACSRVGVVSGLIAIAVAALL